MREFVLERHFAKWEFAARYHMTASDAESMSLAGLLEFASPADRAAFDNQWLGYSETRGAPNLRAVIAETYDTLSGDNIQCFAGAQEGIYAAMRVMLNTDDHLIVTVPNYQAAETVPLEICAVSGVPLRGDNDWQLDLDDLSAAIRPNTKMVSINFPNNPTGATLRPDVYRGLVDLCRKHGLWLFSDEVYRGLEQDETKRMVQAADAYEKGLSLNVMSKA